jgi:hypothetical protein
MNQPLPAEVSRCRLEITATRAEKTSLTLGWAVHNYNRANVYVFNRLYHRFDEEEGYLIDPNLVVVDAARDQVVLAKKLVPVPPDIDVEKPVVPCVTRVPGGQRFTESLTLPLPLRPWTPYFQPGDDALAEKPVICTAFFEVGFFVAAPGSDDLAKTVPTPGDPALYFYPFPVDRQLILRVGPLAAKVPVRLPRD